MNGPHDMGGMQCYGPVIPEVDEPLFHAEWERKVLAITVAMGFTGSWNIDISRHARESIPAIQYLNSSYYEIWLAGLQKLMLERQMVTNGELETGIAATEAKSIKRQLKASEVADALATGGPVDRPSTVETKFAVGDGVTTRKINPLGHTRLPRYARDCMGKIDSIQGFHVFPDTNAKGGGEAPCWLYSVRFSAKELFGESADPNQDVLIDCWEPYLVKG